MGRAVSVANLEKSTVIADGHWMLVEMVDDFLANIMGFKTNTCQQKAEPVP